MPRWKRRVEDLLYDSESVEESVEIGTARVVVTSHRVLAFTPEMDGENFMQAELPNVDSVDLDSQTSNGFLSRGIKAGLIGGVLVATGVIVDFGAIFGDVNFDTDAAQEVGAGGLISFAQRFMNFMAQLDYLMRVFGALMLFLAAVLLGVFWFLRDPTLRITVAGDNPDIHLPRPENITETRARLEAALFPDQEFDEAEYDDQTDDTDPLSDDAPSWSDSESSSGANDHAGSGESGSDEEYDDIFGSTGTVDDDAVRDG